MPYTANPTDPSQPTIDVKASTAAAEFRALKLYLQGLVFGTASALPGQQFGCTMSTTGASTAMSISAGRWTDSTGVQTLMVPALVKTTAAWAVGDGAGGLDAGAIANGSWYHYYVIRRPDTGVVDVLLSLSATAPTLPAGYTQFRRIGSGRTNGSAQWLAFSQDGDYFVWAASSLDVASNPNSSAAQTSTLTVPTGVKVQAIINVVVNDTAVAGVGVLVSDLSVNDETPVYLGNMSCVTSVVGIPADCETTVRTNTSGQIRYRLNAAIATIAVYVRTRGWYDTRGRLL